MVWAIFLPPSHTKKYLDYRGAADSNLNSNSILPLFKNNIYLRIVNDTPTKKISQKFSILLVILVKEGYECLSKCLSVCPISRSGFHLFLGRLTLIQPFNKILSHLAYIPK